MHDTHLSCDGWFDKPASQEAERSRDWKHVEKNFPQGTTPDQVEGCMGNPDNKWRWATCPSTKPCVDCGCFQCHSDDFVVAVNGGCRDDGRPSARAAIAVYFGPANLHNFVGTLDCDPEPTSQKAELCAAIKALEILKYISEEYKEITNIRSIIVKSDSAYMIKSMTQNLSKWRDNGDRTTRGSPVQNQEFLTYLDSLANSLSREDLIDVFFWHVPREYNKIADTEVNMVLDAQISRPKVYIVALHLDKYPNMLDVYAGLFELLKARAEVSFIKTLEDIFDRADGSQTRFFFMDDGIMDQQNRIVMKTSARAICQRGCIIVIGGWFPYTRSQDLISSFFEDVFGFTWQCAGIKNYRYQLSRHTINLDDQQPAPVTYGFTSALLLANVPKEHNSRVLSQGSEVYATFAHFCNGFVSYIGDLREGAFFTNTVLDMLDLPPVYEDSVRLLAAATHRW